jgi:hypothetical protein
MGAGLDNNHSISTPYHMAISHLVARGSQPKNHLSTLPSGHGSYNNVVSSALTHKSFFNSLFKGSAHGRIVLL